MRVLMTGFEPFGGEAVNPSWEAVARLPDEACGAQIVKRRLPVEYAGSEQALLRLIAAESPDFVICVGQAAGRREVSVECRAVNRDHADSPDNLGELRRYAPISDTGREAYFTDAPVEAIVEAVRAAGIPCGPSFSAGTYVCNHVYYRLLAAHAYGLFIHVPLIPAQAPDGARPSMALPDIARALEIAVEVAARWFTKD